MLGFENIETSKKEITALLQKHKPESVTQFHIFCAQYDQVVFDFFDTKNNLSLAMHIKHMESNFAIVKHATHDEQFITARILFIDLSTQIQSLINTLKGHTHSRNALQLAFKVRPFKTLLPPMVTKRGDVSLFLSLRHRLRC